MAAVTLADALSRARLQFLEGGIDDAGREARLLVGGILGLDPAALISGGGRLLTAEEAGRVEDALMRRLNREPTYRILGRRPFLGLVLSLSADTLEPRPDTEVLVERLVPIAKGIVEAKGTCRLLDLGTGTGAICLGLIDAVPGVSGVGTDVSAGALETARANAHINGLSDRFETLESDWFAAVDGKFDIIVSNPPYIRSTVVDDLAEEVRRFDPRRALDGGDDGLDAYRKIAEGALDRLEPDGVVAFEIGFDQKESVTKLMAGKGFRLVEAAKDLAGHDRVLIFAAV